MNGSHEDPSSTQGAAGDGSGRRRYRVVLAPAARRAIERDLPGAVAAAVVGFLYGPLADNPHRVGKALRFELEGRWSARRGQYRVIYRIDDGRVVVEVVRMPTAPTRTPDAGQLSSAGEGQRGGDGAGRHEGGMT